MREERSRPDQLWRWQKCRKALRIRRWRQRQLLLRLCQLATGEREERAEFIELLQCVIVRGAECEISQRSEQRLRRCCPIVDVIEHGHGENAVAQDHMVDEV